VGAASSSMSIRGGGSSGVNSAAELQSYPPGGAEELVSHPPAETPWKDKGDGLAMETPMPGNIRCVCVRERERKSERGPAVAYMHWGCIHHSVSMHACALTNSLLLHLARRNPPTGSSWGGGWLGPHRVGSAAAAYLNGDFVTPDGVVVRRASPTGSDDGSVVSSRRAPSLGMDMEELRDLEGFSFDPSFSEVGLDQMEAGPDDHGLHQHAERHRTTPQHPWEQALMAHPLVEVEEAAVNSLPISHLPLA
jgi:hypothetical protein